MIGMGAACACHRATDVVPATNAKSIGPDKSENDSMVCVAARPLPRDWLALPQVPISEEKESSGVKHMHEDSTPTPANATAAKSNFGRFLFGNIRPTIPLSLSIISTEILALCSRFVYHRYKRQSSRTHATGRCTTDLSFV
jgi:hypothetical protein